MRLQQLMVKHFHEKYSLQGQLDEMPTGTCSVLMQAGDDIWQISQMFSGASKDPRIVRAHHLIEELGELIRAMGEGDEVEALDGFADLLYILLGTSHVFNWPAADAFQEVHESNMTKGVHQDRPGHPVKGKDFKKPDLKRVLRDWRK